MLNKQDLHLIKKILNKYLDRNTHQAFIFGSYVSGTDTNSSDIDIGIQGKTQLPGNKLVEIEEEFGNSELPYQVDVVDFNQVSKQFKRQVNKRYLSLY